MFVPFVSYAAAKHPLEQIDPYVAFHPTFILLIHSHNGKILPIPYEPSPFPTHTQKRGITQPDKETAKVNPKQKEQNMNAPCITPRESYVPLT